MGGGSAKPRRKKAASAGLRYEPARSGPVIQQREKRERPWLVALVVLPTATAVIAVMGMAADMWGPDAWGGLAPAWPGGGYGFGLTLGLLMALVAVATFV